MTKTLYLLQSHKFSSENIQATLACPKCEEIFKKEFPSELEGHFKSILLDIHVFVNTFSA